MADRDEYEIIQAVATNALEVVMPMYEHGHDETIVGCEQCEAMKDALQAHMNAGYRAIKAAADDD